MLVHLWHSGFAQLVRVVCEAFGLSLHLLLYCLCGSWLSVHVFREDIAWMCLHMVF